MARKKRKKNPPKAGSRAAKRGGRKAARTRARNHAIRVAAGRKAARTRKRRHGGGKRKTTRRTTRRRAPKRGKRRGKKRSRASVLKGVATRARRRKKLPDHIESHGVVYENRPRRRRRRKNPAVEAAETPRRRRAKRRSRKATKHRRAPKRRSRASYRRKRPGHKKHNVRRHYRKVPGRKRRVLVKGHRSHEESRRRRRRNPARRRRSNPIDGWKEMGAGVLGVALGYVIASGGDRFIMTHALTGSIVNGQANLTDTPPAGSIYNSEAMSLPLWSSWQRMGVAAVSVGIPLFVASQVRSGAWKSFFQLAGFGALARTAGKAADDGIAALAMQMPNPTLVRLYAPEMAAINAIASGQQTGAPAGTFARLLGRFLGTTVPATDSSNPATQCPPGYTLDVGGSTCSTPNVLPPPPATQTAPPSPPTTTTYPPEGGGGGGGGSEPPYNPPPPVQGGSPPVSVPVSTPARAPFNPLTCSPDPDPC